MTTTYLTLPRLRDDTMDRMNDAFQRVQDRLRRSTSALEESGLPYAVIGGNAVIHWINQANPAAFRFTQDVDVLVRRTDLPEIAKVMEAAGFRYRHVRGIDLFFDGPKNSVADAVHVLFADERVQPTDLAPAASVDESIPGDGYRVLNLEALLRMKLTSFRLKDQTHIDDMLQVGLIDASLKDRMPPELAARFQQVLDQFEPRIFEIGNELGDSADHHDN